jgi:uncharacterized repeat protein (TIGR03803 family)
VQKNKKSNRQPMEMRIQHIALLSAALCLTVPSAPAASYSMVRSFGLLTNVSGLQPQSPLVQDMGGTLYGTTSKSEGDLLTGTIFKIQPDGTGFQVLMNFSNSNGANPSGGLVLSGSTLYGTTYEGGSNNNGIVFAIGTDGSDFTVLKTFSAVTAGLTNGDGANPKAGLILSDGILYGTAYNGGTSGYGTVFAVNTSSMAFTNLYNFTSGSDGGNPAGTLVLSGNTLYGTASLGDLGDMGGSGTLFMLGINGSPAFSVLYNFTALDIFGNNNDGANPQAGLVLSSNILYGTASSGGTDGNGTVFAFNLGTTNFTNLYNFTGASDGANPDGGVIISGNTLYGTTLNGGDIAVGGFGTVFAFNLSTGFTNLYEFDDGGSGAYPAAGLLLSGGWLYGTTTGASGPDDAGGNGTLFAVNASSMVFTNLYAFIYSDGVAPQANLVISGNTLYGTTSSGGNGGNGTVFQVNSDGTAYEALKSFSAFGPTALDSTNSDGADPQAGLVMSGGWLYGTTYYGGPNGYGTVFAVNPGSLVFSNLYNFTGGNDGANPQGGLVLSGSLLYGTAANGGGNGVGTVFSINTNGTDFTLLKTFSATTSGTNGDGANPQAGLILSNDVLYGTTYNGGTGGYGTVFAVNASTTNFANLHSFTNGSDGANPCANLVLSDGSLYGTTYYGGGNNNGTVFLVATNDSTYMLLKTFSATTQSSTGPYTNSDGASPQAGLVSFGNWLYGTTAGGGSNGYGTVFAVNTNGAGAGFTNLYTFNFNNGANPQAAGLLFSVNTLYGMTFGGGSVGDGTVFALTLFPLPIPLNIQLAGNNVILTWANAAFSLQSAPAVTGVYTNVPGATSPYTNAITGSHQFYRLEASEAP